MSKPLLNEKQKQLLVEFRRELHAWPELSEQEYKTHDRIASFLKEYCKPSQLLERIGKTGLIAVFDSGKEGPELMFRADHDALPIQEVNQFEYASTVKEVSHMCGHDGHTASLMGLAMALSEQPPERGRVLLLFQPSEENGRGAASVLADERFKAFRPDYVFAWHNLPGFPLHQVVYRAGNFTSSVTSLIIRLHGKTAHAAEPENGVNPALPIAEILTRCEGLSNNDPERKDFTLITPIHITMGEVAYGVSAGYGELHLTIRTWNEARMNKLADQVLAVVSSVSEKHSIRSETAWTQTFQANKNNPQAVDSILKSARRQNLSTHERAYPFKWGEDFGFFTQQFKGAMFGIGSGESCPALHNPDYDFPDELIQTGANMFFNIIQEYNR